VGVLVVGSGACATAPRAAGGTGSVPSPSPFPRAPRPPDTRTPPAALPGALPAALPGGVTAGPFAPGTAVVDSALTLLGVAYRYGGDDPATGLDCSGLVQHVFAQQGVLMPRTVEEQYRVGERIGRGDLQAGDLIFFTTIGPGATHVGIALGPSQPGAFVHAPATGGQVRVERYDSSYWGSRIVGMRRVVS
jgi:cell wall-associated NlpC family hydrolase